MVTLLGPERLLCVLVGFLLVEDLQEDSSPLISKQSSVIGLLFLRMGQSSCCWTVCQTHQLHLASGISESKRSCCTHAGDVWDVALTSRQYDNKI